MHISPNDTNQYRHITLSNGLRVLLVHDHTAKKSAAAVAVNVGHFDDPIDRQGLSHFLEHMLFLGTEKYPEVGDFQNYVSQHGGQNNAWTGTEHTCYFFDILPNAFYRGLDRFSQFFISPLFNPEALDKERQAVESEYRLKYKEDSRRLYQVHKEVINPAHPFSKFSVGNMETLGDRNGVSIRPEIVEFYSSQYSSDIMTLVLLGPQTLNELEKWANELFSAISNQSAAGKVIKVPYKDSNSTPIFVAVEPLKEIRKLIVTFPLPSIDKYYRSKPLSYIAHLLGYEGKGSLMLALKEKGWITSLSAGGGTSGSNYREFTINCTLTLDGLAFVDSIVQAIFNFISLIKTSGVEEWRYQEKKSVLEAAFQFREPANALDLVSHLVVNMQHYSSEDIIYGDYMMMEFDEEQIRSLLDFFNPSNMRLTLLSKGQQYSNRAKWYDTPYSVSKITAPQIKNYTQSSDLELQLPEANPFIFNVLKAKPLETLNPTPTVIDELPGFKLWHMQDNEFRVPKGVVYIAIDSPYAVSNPSNIVKTRLCVEMFLDSLSVDTYQAEIAGMGYTMYTHQGGVTLTVSGFTQKQEKLIKAILDRFNQRDFDPTRFENIKNQLMRNWKNSAQDRPLSQLFSALTGILQPNNPPYSVLVEELEMIEVDELASFVSNVLATLHVEMFVFGDWTQSDALSLGTMIKDALRVKNQRYEEALRPLIMLGKNGTFEHEVRCEQDDSATVVYYQCDDTSPRSIALYSLANHLMSATFFHEIRTKQQLGYMVGTGNLPLNRHPGIVLYVQSPKVAPINLMASIDEFLNAFHLVLMELDEYQWHSSKKGLWNQISVPDKTLRGRAQRLWVAIGNKDHLFDQKEKVLEELKNLSRADMIRFVIDELKPRTANRLIMHSKGNSHQEEKNLDIGIKIGSIDEFQLRPRDIELG